MTWGNIVKSVNRAIAGPGGARPAGPAVRVPPQELMDDRLLDALLERSRDEAGGLRLTGEGAMLGELVKAVLARGPERLPRPGRTAVAMTAWAVQSDNEPALAESVNLGGQVDIRTADY